MQRKSREIAGIEAGREAEEIAEGKTDEKKPGASTGLLAIFTQ
jgi:hypothetical protein